MTDHDFKNGGMYDLPVVHRVQEGNHSTVQPPLDPDAGPLGMLLWHAAVVAYDTGLRIFIGPGSYRVRSGKHWIEQPGQVSVQVGNGSTVMSISDAWTYLNGVDAAARATESM